MEKTIEDAMEVRLYTGFRDVGNCCLKSCVLVSVVRIR